MDRAWALSKPHSANPPDALARLLAKRVEENVALCGANREFMGWVDVVAGY